MSVLAIWPTIVLLDLFVPVTTEAPRRVRDALGGQRRTLPDDLLGPACLVATELVNEAFLRGGEGFIRVRVSAGRGRVRIEVLDDRTDLPGWQSALVSDISKRILDGASSRWGILGHRRRVSWAEIDSGD